MRKRPAFVQLAAITNPSKQRQAWLPGVDAARPHDTERETKTPFLLPKLRPEARRPDRDSARNVQAPREAERLAHVREGELGKTRTHLAADGGAD